MSVVPRSLRRSVDDTATARDRDALVIEPMHRRHLRAVMPIEFAAYDRSWSRSVFESELDQVRSGSRYYVVAKRRRRVIGFAGLWFLDDPDGDHAHVTNIVVDRDERRSGVATELMLHLADHVIARGCVAWTLEVRASSTGAHALYRRFGFAPAGVRKNYYEHGEDAIVMWCHDIATPDYAGRLDAMR
jgi:ribosomal-protein-alanine N-acetyltransferase